MARFILDVNDLAGVTTVLIEHDMGVIMDISDRVSVLDFGRCIADGTPGRGRQRPGRPRRLSRARRPTREARPKGSARTDPRRRHARRSRSCWPSSTGATATAASPCRRSATGSGSPSRWRQLHARVRDFAHGLASLGVGPGEVVAVLGDNRPEWLISELAAQSLGACTVGIYPTSVGEEIVHVLTDGQVRVVVAEDQEQVDKIIELKDRLPGRRDASSTTTPGASRCTRCPTCSSSRPWRRRAGSGPRPIPAGSTSRSPPAGAPTSP